MEPTELHLFDVYLLYTFTSYSFNWAKQFVAIYNISTFLHTGRCIHLDIKTFRMITNNKPNLRNNYLTLLVIIGTMLPLHNGVDHGRHVVIVIRNHNRLWE